MAIIPVKDLTTEDILYGDRNTQYRWEVLEHSNGVDYLVGTLDGVKDGSLSWVQNAAVKGRGKMEVIDLEAAQPGMLRIADLALETARIRPVMTLNSKDQTGSYEDVWVESRRNFIPNPEMTSITGWNTNLSGAQATLTPTPDGIQIDFLTAIGTGVALLYPGAPIPGAVGDTWIGSFDRVTVPTGFPKVTVQARQRIYGSATTDGYGPNLELTPGVTTAVQSTAITASTTYTNSRLILWSRSAIPAGARIVIKNSLMEKASTLGPFFSGSTASSVPYRRYLWLGTAGNSVSVAEVRSQQWVPTGETVIPEIPWGTFLLEKASEDWEDTGRIWKLSLLDRSTVPSQDVVDQSYAVPAGTNILQEVRSILGTSGEYMAIDQSVDLATRTGMVWEAGTSKLNIINDLLDAAGYNSLWMDGWGNFQATPRVLPADRSIEYELLTGLPRELVDGSQSIYSSDWTRERDSFGVPNKVIAVQAAGGEDEEALVGQWTNEDPASPYSYISRGRWVPWVLDSVDCPEGTEAEILEFLEARARATLIQMSAVQAEVKITHLPIPVRVSDVLRFANTRADIDARHVITRLDLDTSPTGLMKSTLQEVISL